MICGAALVNVYLLTAVPMTPGDYRGEVVTGGQLRTYVVHVPKLYDGTAPVAVVLALHGIGMNGPMMMTFSGLNEKADREGFVVVYPNGMGIASFLTWNAGGKREKGNGRPDDVAFIAGLLNNLETMINVDAKRIYATGMSNGGMMCYRLAAELSDRLAAIAPVAAAMAIDETVPANPVSVIHFHGTKDDFVPFAPKNRRTPFPKSVQDSVQTWVIRNGCAREPQVETLSKGEEALRVTRCRYRGGIEGAEVVLVTIEGGGHTWPGRPAPVGFIGKSTVSLSANDLMWDFFQKHKRP